MDIQVLDIGATTVNLLEAVVDETGLVPQRQSFRFVRLGEGTLVSGVISQDAWHGTLSSIDALLERARPKRSGRRLAVATSALREATNGPAFRKVLEERLGTRIQVLSAREEAMLAYAGARSTLCRDDVPTAVVDLGGGTVNCALGRGDSCLATASFPLGVARLWPAFSPGGSLSAADARALRSLVSRSTALLANQAAELGAQRVVLTSGHARAVREAATRGTGHFGPTGLLDLETVRAAHVEAVGTRPVDLVARGVRPERAPGFAIATALVLAIMETLGCSRALVVDRGLREGVALAACREALAAARQGDLGAALSQEVLP